MLGTWISSMVQNYTFDGLRLDTTINVEPDFFEGFVKSAGVFATGETMDGDNKVVCKWANPIGSLLNYPIYYPLTRAFSSTTGNINDLVTTIYTMKHNCIDPTAFGLFSENHDVERFASMTDDMSQAKNIMAYTLMGDGIPIIYQGQEQHMKGGVSPYTNRAPLWTTKYNTEAELYLHATTLVKARKHFVRTGINYTTQITNVIYEDYHSFAMRKGINGAQVVTVLNNNGESTDDFELYITSGHDWTSGTTVTEVLTCTDITVNGTGCLTVPMGQGKPKVMYPKHLLKDSGLCGNPEPSKFFVPTAYESTISGQPTVIETTVPTSSGDSTSPSAGGHAKLALGSAPQTLPSITAPLATVALSLFFASSGCTII